MKHETPKPDPLARLIATIEGRRIQHAAAQRSARRDREDAKIEARHRRCAPWWQDI